jgi:hypothetical protein
LAVPSPFVSPLMVIVPPSGLVTTADAAAFLTAWVPSFAVTLMVRVRSRPPPVTVPDAVTFRLAAARTRDPVAEPAYPADISVAVTPNENVPDAPAGAASVTVDDALAPGASEEIELGENAADHPLGTAAARLKADAEQVALFLFVTVIV